MGGRGAKSSIKKNSELNSKDKYSKALRDINLNNLDMMRKRLQEKYPGNKLLQKVHDTENSLIQGELKQLHKGEGGVSVSGNRWQKGDIDRVYYSAYDLGLNTRSNIPTFNGKTIDPALASEMEKAKTYIDVKTGKVFSTNKNLEKSAKKHIKERLALFYKNAY